MENARKLRYQTCHNRKKENYLVSEPNFHTIKFFTENLLPLVMRKTQMLMNKPVYLGLPILELSKKQRVSVYTSKRMIFIKTLQKMLKLISTSNYELDRPVLKVRNKKIIG